MEETPFIKNQSGRQNYNHYGLIFEKNIFYLYRLIKRIKPRISGVCLKRVQKENRVDRFLRLKKKKEKA